MYNKNKMSVLKKILGLMLAILFFINYGQAFAVAEQPPAESLDIDEIARKVNTYVPDQRYADDAFILITLKEALMGAKEHNGRIGACLVREVNGEILGQSHNQQNEPYFKSDQHAEMVLLDKFEDKMRFTWSHNPNDSARSNPRINMNGLVLYTSVESCPMCLTRIINSGVKKLYYAAPDNSGGMAHRLNDLPPSWQDMARGMVIEPARCSPVLRELAQQLFYTSHALRNAMHIN